MVTTIVKYANFEIISSNQNKIQLVKVRTTTGAFLCPKLISTVNWLLQVQHVIAKHNYRRRFIRSAT
jgi:hypothetical protein